MHNLHQFMSFKDDPKYKSTNCECGKQSLEIMQWVVAMATKDSCVWVIYEMLNINVGLRLAGWKALCDAPWEIKRMKKKNKT